MNARPCGESAGYERAGKPDGKTIDISLSWPAAMEILIAALENGTDKGKAMARSELRALAKELDEYGDVLRTVPAVTKNDATA